MAKILLTGAAGFIGSHTADRLLREGHEVLGVDNLSTGKLSNLEAALADRNFRFEQIDVTDAGCVDRCLKGFRADAAIHLAAVVSVQQSLLDPRSNFRINVGGTQVLAEALLRERVPRMVFASSAAVYGNPKALPTPEDTDTKPISPYGAAKLASEALLLAYGRCFPIRVCCLRYFNVYGPRQDPASPYSGVLSIFHDRYAQGRAVAIYGDGNQTRDFVYVKDVATINASLALASDLQPGRLNVCRGEACTLNAILRIFQAAYPGAAEPIYGEERPGDIRHSCGDPARLVEALGRRPATPIKAGLEDLMRWHALRPLKQ